MELLNRLIEEKEKRIKGGIYHELQIRLTYNSNKIEGSKLSEAETRYIYETKTLAKTDPIKVDDLIETVNHFRAIDYCIDHYNDELTEGLIKKLHYILKNGTMELDNKYYIAGEYKKRDNIVGDIETTKVEDVEKETQKLITKYNLIKQKTLEDLITFHYKFECIHPFYDGNGRVGRLIMFKECLKYNIVPPLIKDDKKFFYFKGLREYENDREYLIQTFLDGQDQTHKLLKILNIKGD